MLIAIFVLLLISVIAIALVVSSGTDSALASNFRTSTMGYYAGLAGLEEARGRLYWKNPAYLKNSVANLMTPADVPLLPVGQVVYLLNPVNGETVAPWDTGNPSTYPDTEFLNEFPTVTPTVQTVQSTSPVNGMPGPSYKWVRITAATEWSLGIDVNGDHVLDQSTPLYYDPANPGVNGAQPALVSTISLNQTARQALEITAYAALPNHTRKMLQYVVAPITYGLFFHATLAVIAAGDGSLPGLNLIPPNDPAFRVTGVDGIGPNSAGGNCAFGNVQPGSTPILALGTTGPQGPAQNYLTMATAIPTGDGGNYTSSNNPAPPVSSYPPTPSIDPAVFLNPLMSSPTGLNQVIQTIRQNADAVISPPSGSADETSLPAAMSAANPMTIYVNGNLTLNGNFTGYGLLVVTGNFRANANAGWRGVVLVVGSGNAQFFGGIGGTGEFDGAFFVAKTLDTTVNPPVPIYANGQPIFGAATFDASQGDGLGIFNNSCWINAALKPPTYKVLSFREIPLTN